MTVKYFPRAQTGLKAKEALAMWPGVRTSRTLHYEGVDVALPKDEAAEFKQVENIWKYHMNNGYDAGAYSFMVGGLGNVYEFRGIQFRSAANGTTLGNNSSFAICFAIGPNGKLTDAMKEGGLYALGLCRPHVQYDTVYPHKKWKPTQCPGSQIAAWIDAGLPGTGVAVPVPPPPLITVPPTAYAPAFAGKLLRHGSEGTQVRLYQQRLRERGWRIGVDGDFGEETENVTYKFQLEKANWIRATYPAAKGLPDRKIADKIVGQWTWNAAWKAPVTK